MGVIGSFFLVNLPNRNKSDAVDCRLACKIRRMNRPITSFAQGFAKLFALNGYASLAALALLLLASLPSLAMTLEVQGNQVFATGPVGDDTLKFEEALAKPGVDTVVFVNSPGGDLWTALRVGRLIADKKLNTVIAGSCVSACSIMFMGGRERSFSDAFRPGQTFIGIHGAHNRDTKRIDSSQQPQIFAFYKNNMGDRFNADVMNQALYDMEDAGALLRVFDAGRLPKRQAFHCKSAQTLRRACAEFKDVDALSLGIVTTTTLTPVNLPPSFQALNRLFGQELAAPTENLSAELAQLAAEKCGIDACRKVIADYPTVQKNSAVAVRAGTGPEYFGVGSAFNGDTVDASYLRALHLCNHIRGRTTQLCEVQFVNDSGVLPALRANVAAHAKALADLKVPAEKHYANENFGGGLTRATALRTSKYNDITPQGIEGVRLYNTQELAQGLKSAEPPVLINVLPGWPDALPGALTLYNGGLAFESAQAELAYETRFAALLKLLAPDVNKPVVFYCAGRDLWMSVNAALRAKKLGYTQVGWYRGGQPAWKEAGLPTAPLVVRAVVN